MKTFAATAAALAARLSIAQAVPVFEERYTGPNGKTQDTSAGGMGPNPSLPGDGGNGLTVSCCVFMHCTRTVVSVADPFTPQHQVTVIDPMGNNSIKNPIYRVISDFDYASFNLGLYQEWIELDLVSHAETRSSGRQRGILMAKPFDILHDSSTTA